MRRALLFGTLTLALLQTGCGGLDGLGKALGCAIADSLSGALSGFDAVGTTPDGAYLVNSTEGATVMGLDVVTTRNDGSRVGLRLALPVSSGPVPDLAADGCYSSQGYYLPPPSDASAGALSVYLPLSANLAVTQAGSAPGDVFSIELSEIYYQLPGGEENSVPRFSVSYVIELQ